MVKLGIVTLIVPRIVLEEFERNRERIAKESAKSLSAHFRLVKEAVGKRLRRSSVRVTAEIYSHALRGRDDDAARRWEEFQSRNSQEKRRGVQ